MIDILNLVYIMIFIPLALSLSLGILKIMRFKFPQYGVFISSLVVSVLTFAISILLLNYAITYQSYPLENNYPICVIQNIPLYFGIYADSLASVFTVFTSLIFIIANIFSYRYLLQNRQGFERFYIYLNLLQFSLFCHFTSSNLIQSVAFLILLSLIDYLFSNFYFQKPVSQENSRKVYEINIFGDFLLLVASISFLYFSTLAPDTINIPTLGFNNINSLGLYSFASLNPIIFVVICMLFVSGALIKSAQFPFSPKVYLASEAPNPAFSIISNPITLATGCFLLLRLYPILNLAPLTFEILKIFGIITAILCTLIAAKENNIKKICSWAAISQIGISVCLLGFKLNEIAVLWILCSYFGIGLISYTLDSVCYSTGSQENIKFLGGLREKLPFSAICFLVGSVSLSGFAFSGFYPRAYTLGALLNEKDFIYISSILLFAFITTFYLFRLYFRIFEGNYRGTVEPKRVGKAMNFGITVLLLPCIFFGFILNNHADFILNFLNYSKSEVLNPFINVLVFIVSAIGYYLAYNIYFAKRLSSIRNRFFRRLASRHFYMDHFISFIFNDLIFIVGKVFTIFERYILNFIYKIPSLITRLFSYFFTKIEANKLNTQFFTIVFWLVFVLLLTSIFYFKTGVIR